MPVYRDGTSEAQFVKEATSGETDLTRRVQTMFADRDKATGHSHWDAFCTPYHLDELCPDCIEVLGLSDFFVDHINAWDREQKELVRATIQVSVEQGMELKLCWALTDDADETRVEVDEGGFVITFYANRERILAELRGHRSAVVY